MSWYRNDFRPSDQLHSIGRLPDRTNALRSRIALTRPVTLYCYKDIYSPRLTGGLYFTQMDNNELRPLFRWFDRK